MLVTSVVDVCASEVDDGKIEVAGTQGGGVVGSCVDVVVAGADFREMCK